MEYRLAKYEESKIIYKIVKDTIKEIYPKYYLSEIVDMFCEFHNEESISEDIKNQKVYILIEDERIIGTGTIKGNHITRVYVLPEFQGKGYGTFIMNHLEMEIGKKHTNIQIDASLPACTLYYNRGYKTVKHGVLECTNDVRMVYEIMEKQVKKTEKETEVLSLRPYKPCDAKVIAGWIRDETALRKIKVFF